MRVYWSLTYILAALITLACWITFEIYWRAQEYVPSVMDNFDLWSQHRIRAVKSAPPLRFVLLGASRIQYGVSPAAFRSETEKLGLAVDPIMLAVNGHYPLAALRDLSEDARFVGIVLVGIDSRGMNRKVWEMQEKFVHSFRNDWSPSRNVHRHILTGLQEFAIAARPDFAVVTIVKRLLDGNGAPHKDYVNFSSDRSGATDYQRQSGNLSAIIAARENSLRESYRQNPPPAPEIWLSKVSEVAHWVEAINSRGGKVIFYREPVSGIHLELDEENYPRPQYWDMLSMIMPATMIDFRDYSELMIDTPDTSHIDMHDIDRHTRALVRILHAKKIL